MKRPWKSRIILLNTLGAGSAIATVLAGVLPEEAAKWMLALSAIINVILRFDTKKPVSFSDDS